MVGLRSSSSISTCSRITRCLKSAQSRWNYCSSTSSSSSSSSSASSPCEEETLVAAVVLERLPLIVPLPKPEVANFRNFSSLERALERRLYLIIKGHPFGSLKDQAIWHFPERVYENEETLRLCAEAILIPDVAKKDDVYYVGNAPCGHMCVKLPANGSPMHTQLKRFFFRSQLVGKLRLAGLNHEDYAWVTKEELLEYFEPEPSAYLKQMLVDDMTVIY